MSVESDPGTASAGDRPVLSVVIACLNAVDTLAVQLKALSSQSCPVPWELLLCDNGSTDGTRAVAESYRSRIPQLRLVDASEVRGAGPARNYGVQLARGEWVAFCDADDEVASDWLGTMASALGGHRFVAGRFEKYRLNDARVLRSRPLQQQDELQKTDIGARLPHAGGGNMGMYRSDFLAIGGFDPQIRWLEDTDLSWRAQLAGIPLTFRPEVVVHVRLRHTFRTMYAQGRQYGAAHALLEERYGRPEPDGSAVDVPVEVGVSRRPRRLSVAWTHLVDHVVAGRFVWRLGWVMGHRGHRPGSVGAGPAALADLSGEGSARNRSGPEDPDATRPIPGAWPTTGSGRPVRS